MPLVAAIVDGEARHLDLLRLTVRTNDAVWSRYAHSYIGLGLTRLMAIGLKKDKKGIVMELISVMRTFNRLEPSRSFPPEGSENCTTVLSSPTLPGWRSTDASVTQGDPMTDFSKSCPVPTADDGVSP
jgi:diacylglycerol kinase (ATP)